MTMIPTINAIFSPRRVDNVLWWLLLLSSSASSSDTTTTTSHTYKRRGAPLSSASTDLLGKEWGSWTFVDADASARPTHDYYAAYPNRDVPSDQFPSHAWQTDPTYVANFLQQSNQLITRAMDAILAEYGHGPNDDTTKSVEERGKIVFPRRLNELKDGRDDAGCTTQRSFDGLTRRILHSILTQDTFTVVMGGHSAAAGHGNHLEQSYTLQIQKVLEPVFARLGVKMTALNIGMGGLGTMHNSMGAGSMYGRDIDYLLWDSGMTERGGTALDLFIRQSILGSETRVPYVDIAGSGYGLVEDLHDHADVDIGIFNTPMIGIPTTEDEVQVQTLPWATQYLKCSPEMKESCRAQRYNGTCWIDRPDHFVPATAQAAAPGGRASWHPGHREHQITGRAIAFHILTAAHAAIQKWLQADNHVLQDNEWHVHNYYQNIQNKLSSLDETIGTCYDDKSKFPKAMCRVPFKARSEMTPRANPKDTSLRSIMKMPDGQMQEGLIEIENSYDPPDVYNDVLEPPYDAINYLNIVENGIDYAPIWYPKVSPFFDSEVAQDNTPPNTGDQTIIFPGKGWGLNTKSNSNSCDGSYDTFCGRDAGNKCLLYAHNDYRGGLYFDSFSGWGIFALNGLQHGVITLRIEHWNAFPNPATKGWKFVNNDPNDPSNDHRHRLQQSSDNTTTTIMTTNSNNSTSNIRRRTETSIRSSCVLVELRRSKRKLKADKSPLMCEDFRFEYAINGGEIQSYDRFETCERFHSVQRVVQIITLLEDPTYVKEGETKNIELAIRMIGCQQKLAYKLSHIYWA